MGRYQWGDQMQIGCDTFLKALEQWAPLSYAEEWDNCGLQVGRRDKAIGKVMIALTPGEAAIQAAVDNGVDMLLTHHPMIFKPTKNVTTDTVLGQSIIKLIRNDINLYCAHTNLDMALGGVNDVLAKALQLQEVEILENITEEYGIGRVGNLAEPMTLEQFLSATAARLECMHLAYQGDLHCQVQKVALCGGSGISYLKAAKKAGADVYVTGDMKYHDAQLASELGICVVDAGHFGTEKHIVKVLAEFAKQQGVEVVIFEEEDYMKHWHQYNPVSE